MNYAGLLSVLFGHDYRGAAEKSESGDSGDGGSVTGLSGLGCGGRRLSSLSSLFLGAAEDTGDLVFYLVAKARLGSGGLGGSCLRLAAAAAGAVLADRLAAAGGTAGAVGTAADRADAILTGRSLMHCAVLAHAGLRIHASTLIHAGIFLRAGGVFGAAASVAASAVLVAAGGANAGPAPAGSFTLTAITEFAGSDGSSFGSSGRSFILAAEKFLYFTADIK